jgi:hypothetical protein
VDFAPNRSAAQPIPVSSSLDYSTDVGKLLYFPREMILWGKSIDKLDGLREEMRCFDAHRGRAVKHLAMAPRLPHSLAGGSDENDILEFGCHHAR